MHNTCLQTSISDLWDPALGASFGVRVRRLNHPYRRDEQQLLPFLKGFLTHALAGKTKLTIASMQMGFFPYHLQLLGLSRVELIDTFGIADPGLSQLPGERSPLGLKIGAAPQRFLNPNSSDPVARAIQARKPDLVYVLHSNAAAIRQLAQWGWTLVWSKRDAKIFARSRLVGRGDTSQHGTLESRGDTSRGSTQIATPP